jgi:putative phage-type endonuclease
MKVLDCLQGSEEWLQARVGKVSASRMADLCAKTKSGYSTSRANYCAELVAERLTGKPAEKFKNAAMEWGSAQEADARRMYCFLNDCTVQQVGLVLHPTLEHACASPDGLVGEDGLLEIKAPMTATHISTLLGGEIDGKYLKQMAWQMNLTGRAWCDFVSFDPRLCPEMQLFIKRVHRDDRLIAELESEVRSFLDEVAGTVDRLRKLYLPTEIAA